MMTVPSKPGSGQLSNGLPAAVRAQHANGAAAPIEHVRLAELAARLGAKLQGVGDRDARITGVQQDSRRVQAGDVFVALRGAAVDGGRFVPMAIEAGAAAVMVAPDQLASPAVRSSTVPLLVVEQPRRALAQAAALVYGQPTQALCVVGLTGTNGKTTTAQLLAAALNASEAQAAVVGTLGYHFAGEHETSQHTSPEADELQRVAATLRARGATHLVMEVSSIALEAERVAEVGFDVGVFTNLTQDHLDYHGDMQRYAAAKDRLFFEHHPRIAVINVDDPHGLSLSKRVASQTASKLWRYSTSAAAAADAEVVALTLESSVAGVVMRVRTPVGELALESPMIGAHNASNLLAALTIALALGIDGQLAANALAGVSSVDGRLERVDDAQRDDVVALVDYAHTPDALSRTLRSLRELSGGRLLCVFGCGGDRDREKRAPMGEAAATLADVAVLTNDNPRSERPEAIADAVLVGMRRVDAANFLVELDRERAIFSAVRQARPGDIVLVAGKGHETYQIVGDETRAFDDRVVLRAALKQRRESV